MARHKEFERDEALKSALNLFRQQGFGATTIDDLRKAIGIGKQSFYDTFKSKEDIYLEALRVYNSDRFAVYFEESRNSKSPLQAIERMLLTIVKEDKRDRSLACLGVSSVCEFGESHSEVFQINKSASSSLSTLLVTLIGEGQKKGEIKSSLQPEDLAQYFITFLNGLKVSARGGAKPEQLEQVIKVAIAGIANSKR